MSRIGKKPIIIPEGVEVGIEGNKVTVKGPKGELFKEFSPEVKIAKEGNQVKVSIEKENKKSKSLWGLSRTLIFNMIEGTTSGFSKKLEIEGVGYKAEMKDGEIVISAGFSHPVNLIVPEGIDVLIEKNVITVSGIDKELVGQFAANIRKVKPPEPYKGKGIKYEGEIIRRKVGKKAAAATG